MRFSSQAVEIVEVGVGGDESSIRWAWPGSLAVSTGSVLQRLVQSGLHTLVELVLNLGVPLDIEVMLIGFQGVPPALPGHVLDQLA